MMQSPNRLSAAVAALILATSFAATPAKADDYKIMDVETPDVSTCLDIDPNRGVFGAFKNSCGFRVAFVMCVIEPTPGSWGASNACVDGRGPGNLDFVAANGVQASHIKGGKGVQWFACRYSTTPGVGNYSGIMRGSIVYEKGRGIKGKCGVTARVLTAISPIPNATQPTGGQAAAEQSGGKQAQTGAGGNSGSTPQGGNMASRMFGNAAPKGSAGAGGTAQSPAPQNASAQPGAPLSAPPTNMSDRLLNKAPTVPALITDGTTWLPSRIGNCTFIFNAVSMGLNNSGTAMFEIGPLQRVGWTGGCDASGLANGAGTLMLETSDGSFGARVEYTGNVANGLLSGQYRKKDWMYDQGKWTVNNGYMGGPEETSIVFTGGCSEYQEAGCNPAAGRSVRDRWVAGVR